MTLLSKIFRNAQLNSASEKIRPIHIRNLNVQETNDDVAVIREDFSLERSRMLEQANQEIASKQKQLQLEVENTRKQMEHELNEWNEQKLSYQQSAYEEGFAQGIEEGRRKALADMQSALKTANEAMHLSLIHISEPTRPY